MIGRELQQLGVSMQVHSRIPDVQHVPLRNPVMVNSDDPGQGAPRATPACGCDTAHGLPGIGERPFDVFQARGVARGKHLLEDLNGGATCLHPCFLAADTIGYEEARIGSEDGVFIAGSDLAGVGMGSDAEREFLAVHGAPSPSFRRMRAGRVPSSSRSVASTAEFASSSSSRPSSCNSAVPFVAARYSRDNVDHYHS